MVSTSCFVRQCASFLNIFARHAVDEVYEEFKFRVRVVLLSYFSHGSAKIEKLLIVDAAQVIQQRRRSRWHVPQFRQNFERDFRTVTGSNGMSRQVAGSEAMLQVVNRDFFVANEYAIGRQREMLNDPFLALLPPLTLGLLLHRFVLSLPLFGFRFGHGRK